MGLIRNTKSRKFTEEQDEWLKKNFDKYSCVKCTEKFNKKFGTNVYYKALVNHCKKFLKLKGYKDHFFTQEQDDFLVDNYQKLDNEMLVKLFNKKFPKKITINTLTTHVSKLGVKKDKYYSKEEIEWLKENYIKDETATETYERYKSLFGNKKSLIGVQTFCKKKLKVHKPNSHKFCKGQKHAHNHYIERRKKFIADNNLDVDYNNYVLTVDNNLIPKEIYTRMSFDGELHLGELTSLFVSCHLAKLKVKEIERKRKGT